MQSGYKAPIIKKAFLILKLLSKNETGLTITELSNQLDISKSTVHGIVAALEEQQALVRDPWSKRFSLGMIFLELASKFHSRLGIKDLALPYLERLSAKTQESVFLGTRAANHVTILDLVESPQQLKITAPIGTQIPLLAGATGKVFLAHESTDTVKKTLQLLKFRKYTPQTITRVEDYLQEIEKVRSLGYALDDEEYMPGVRAVATIIQEINHQLFAIWVVGFTPRMTNGIMNKIATETKLTAQAIRNKLAASMV